jgi:hypothetical protein
MIWCEISLPRQCMAVRLVQPDSARHNERQIEGWFLEG